MGRSRSPGSLSIQQKFRFEISEIPRAQWNCTFRLHRPDPSHQAWESSRHFTTPTMVSPRNDVWETNAEIPYWWRVTTQICVVLLIDRAAWQICSSQSDWVVMRLHQYGIFALVSQTSFCGETNGSIAKFRLFCQAKATARLVINNNNESLFHQKIKLHILCYNKRR